MSTHAFIPDPVINQFFHVPLQNGAIIVSVAMVCIGIAIVYALFYMNREKTVNLMIFG